MSLKLSLIRPLVAELKNRYGTQQVAADAMEMHQSEISDLYNEKHARFSLIFLITMATKLGKQVYLAVK